MRVHHRKSSQEHPAYHRSHPERGIAQSPEHHRMLRSGYRTDPGTDSCWSADTRTAKRIVNRIGIQVRKLFSQVTCQPARTLRIALISALSTSLPYPRSVTESGFRIRHYGRLPCCRCPTGPWSPVIDWMESGLVVKEDRLRFRNGDRRTVAVVDMSLLTGIMVLRPSFPPFI